MEGSCIFTLIRLEVRTFIYFLTLLTILACVLLLLLIEFKTLLNQYKVKALIRNSLLKRRNAMETSLKIISSIVTFSPVVFLKIM